MRSGRSARRTKGSPVADSPAETAILDLLARVLEQGVAASDATRRRRRWRSTSLTARRLGRAPVMVQIAAHSSGREPCRTPGARPANRPVGVRPSHRRDRRVAEMLRTSYSFGTALVSVDMSRDFDALGCV